jgi:hypothetical protein
MGAKFDLTSSLAVLVYDVADSKRRDFADTKSCVDRKDEGETVTLGVTWQTLWHQIC